METDVLVLYFRVAFQLPTPATLAATTALATAPITTRQDESGKAPLLSTLKYPFTNSETTDSSLLDKDTFIRNIYSANPNLSHLMLPP